LFVYAACYGLGSAAATRVLHNILSQPLAIIHPTS
jgi:hypothetical protein